MQFHIVDTEAAYRRLLDTQDAAQRQAIFRQELVEPFAGLVQFLGGDGLAAFASWGMSADQFAHDRREPMAAIIAALVAGDAWNRAVKALEQGGRPSPPTRPVSRWKPSPSLCAWRIWTARLATPVSAASPAGS